MILGSNYVGANLTVLL